MGTSRRLFLYIQGLVENTSPPPFSMFKKSNYFRYPIFCISEFLHFPPLPKGVRGNMATPGEFRKSQNWIDVAGCTLQNATYVPPPLHLLMDCLGVFDL